MGLCSAPDVVWMVLMNVFISKVIYLPQMSAALRTFSSAEGIIHSRVYTAASYMIGCVLEKGITVYG